MVITENKFYQIAKSGLQFTKISIGKRNIFIPVDINWKDDLKEIIEELEEDSNFEYKLTRIIIK